jgi:hypothetical protein
MVFAVGVGLILAAALVVCLPLFRPAPLDAAAGSPDDARARWQKQKREAYAAIKEAELDFQMGKLATADYDLLRAAEEARALEALRALEDGAAGGTGGRGEARARACEACGATVASGGFCGACGHAVPS